MSLATRVIPIVLTRGKQMAKGECFDSWRNVGSTEQAVRIHQARNVDELILLDIAATKEKRQPDLGLIAELTRGCFMPVTVGGGVRSVEDAAALFKAGADKVALCTAAFEEPDLIADLAARYGRQAIVVAVDYRGDEVFVRNGARSTRLTPLAAAQLFAKLGAGELLLTDINREGTMIGYDLATLREVCGAVDIPVVANGGCGEPKHMVEAVQCGAAAVAASAMFLFTDTTPAAATLGLARAGIEVREGGRYGR